MSKYNVLLKGPLLSQSGYGHQARFALRSLRHREDKFNIFLLNNGWGGTSWVVEDDEERRWIDKKLQETIEFHQGGGQFDGYVFVGIPNEFEKHAPVSIIYTAGIESNKIAPQWIEKCNQADKIITISEHSKFGFENTSYEARDENTGQVFNDYSTNTPVSVVRYPVRDIENNTEEVDLKNIGTDFNFLTMAQWGPRKNIENNIRWFVEEFFNRDVGLILKLSTTNNSLIDRRVTKQRVENILSDYKERECSIYLLHGSMTDEEVNSLYCHDKVKVLLSATHGEGFGLPIFEMAQVGKPVIAPDWSGHVDYLYKDGTPMFANVDYTIRPISRDAVWEGVLHKDSMWCYPDQSSFKMNMRKVYENYDEYKEKAEELSEYIKNTFTKDSQYGKFADVVLRELEGESINFDEVQVIE